MKEKIQSLIQSSLEVHSHCSLELSLLDYINDLKGGQVDTAAVAESVSLSELIDKLVIVNLKLFKLKDLQQESDDPEKLAQSAKKDVSLCKERNLLKNAIQQKFLALVVEAQKGSIDMEGGAEVKMYGKAERRP